MADFIEEDGDDQGAEYHGEEGEEGGGDADEDEGGTGKSVAPQFRPAQTEREIEARRSSHAFLVEQRESEPWSDATLHAADSEESRAVRETCFT